MSRNLLLQWLCAGLFLEIVEHLCELTLLLLGFGILKASSDALHIHDIDAGYGGLDFLLYGDQIKYLIVCDESHDLGTYLGLDHGNL